MKTVVTGDESWIYGYDPERKAQSSQWKTGVSKGKNGPPSSEQSESDVDSFFDHESIVYHEYTPGVLC